MSVRRSQMNTQFSTPGSNSKQSAPSQARRPRRRRNLLSGFVERLEDRTLFNTVITDTDPLTATPPTATFEYKDLKGQNVRVVVHGDVSAEFVFARVTKGDEKSGAGWNDVILGEPVAAGSKEDGRDLFHVYVAQASIDSYISIAAVPEVTADNRPMQPYTGSVSLRINTTLRGPAGMKSTASGTGNIVLGTRTRTIPNVNNTGDVPIRSDNFNGQGIFPAPAKGKLVAGLSTAADVSIGKFMFGGAVMGNVRIEGSIESFYCGALLTGVTEGTFNSNAPQDPQNFFVGGDVRNILVKGSVGTDEITPGPTLFGRVSPTYTTGVDILVKGRVGQIRTGQDYYGFGKILNSNPGLGLRTRQQELEFRIDAGQNRGNFTEFENGQFGDGETFFNDDTFETAQFLGSINSKQTGNNSVQVNGLIQSFVNINDTSDYYAVPLMAGQTVSVRLLSPVVTTTTQVINGKLVTTTTERKSILHAGVFDPDNRLIAADYSNVSDTTSQSLDPDPAQQQLFSITADKPGIYRFAVAHDSGFGQTADRLGEFQYQLQITGVGNLGLGGLVAAETISAPAQFTNTDINSIHANIDVVHGDLGAVYSITDYIVSSAESGYNGIAEGGDFRAIDAMSLGVIDGDTTTTGFTLTNTGAVIQAYTGSVGMIRARGTAAENALCNINRNAPQRALPNIGGDIQWISAQSTLITDIAANGNIGVVQAGQFGLSVYAGSISADADGKGKPGVIDLIDVTQDLGTNAVGGPVISAGPRGNVRYIHVAPTGTAYRPRVFGGGSPEDTTFVPGQSFTYTDDSGANVRITPTEDLPIDPLTGLPILDANGNPTVNSGTLTVLSYPIAPSVTNPFSGGGLAIIRVTSTRGLLIDSSGPTEIGDIVSTGSGPSLVEDVNFTGGPDGIAGNGDETYVIDPNSTNDNSVTLRGTKGTKGGLIDVFNIRGNNFNFIKNTTAGEMVNAQIGATYTIDANNLGWARSSIRPGMVTEGATVFDLANAPGVEGNIFPYLNTKNAFTIAAIAETSFAAHDIRARQAIGNLAVTGIVENVRANSDGVGVKGVFEGINGAMYALGQWRRVDIGEGVLPSGTGNMAKAGIFACCTDPGANPYCGRIELVVGNGADIRGDIASNTAIGTISLTNGSIINADIWIISAFDGPAGTGADLLSTREFGGGGVIHTVGGTKVGSIDKIVITGDGGIMGGSLLANFIGPVTVSGGYGVFNTEWFTVGTGRFAAINASGFGLRGITINGGQSLDSLTATGDGHRLRTTQFSAGVRLSENASIDPFFGTRPNGLTDLHAALGTTAASPVRKGTSASGSIDLSILGISRDTGPIKANTIRASEFNVPNLLTSIETTDYVDSLKLVMGRANTIAIGKDATRMQVDAAGDVGLVSIGGSFKGSSGFRSNNGKIGTFITGNTLYGDIYALKGFDTIRIGSSYGSQGSRTPASIGSFITNGDLLTSSKFTVGKNVQRLVIGGNVEDGAVFDIGGTLGTKTIIGDEIGDIVVG